MVFDNIDFSVQKLKISFICNLWSSGLGCLYISALFILLAL